MSCTRCLLHRKTCAGICGLIAEVLGNADMQRAVSKHVDAVRVVTSKHRYHDTDITG